MNSPAMTKLPLKATKADVPAPSTAAITAEVGEVRQQMVSLLTLLMRLIDAKGPVVVHVTAAHAGEGVSTIATELASVAARSGWCKAALIDANRVQPGGQAGAVSAAPGRAFGADGELVLSWRQPPDAALATGGLNWPGEFSPRVETTRALYDWLRENYTLTIVDCPPLLAPLQPGLTAGLADGVVFVLQAGVTQIGDVERSQEVLRREDGTVLGVVLNKCPPMPGYVTRLGS
jgi:Mrp family chromosome partitioning ATPase